MQAKALRELLASTSIVALLGLAQTLCAGQASAQTTPSAPSPAAGRPIEKTVEEVIVHARNREETATQAPLVVTAVSGAALTQSGVTDMTSLENLVPNIKIAPGFLLDTFNIRGIGTANANSGFEQQVGLFIDGAYYGNGHWVNGAYVDLDDVEVDEGPQGVHLGKNTIAGAVLINTKNPGDHFEGYVKGGYEFDAAERYGEAMISGPITDTLGARLVVRASKMDGWARNYVTGRADPGIRDDFARLTLQWKPTANFSANVKLSLDNTASNGPESLTNLLDCGGPNNTPGPYLLPQAEDGGGLGSCKRDFTVSNANLLPQGGGIPRTNSMYYVPAYTMTTNLHWRQSFGELTSTTAWNEYKLKSWGNSGISTYADGVGAIPGENDNANETWSQELRYQTKFDFPVNILLGLWYQHTDFSVYEAFGLVSPALNGVSLSPLIPSTGPVWDTNADKIRQPGESKAAFLELQWNITKTIEVDAGARASLEKKWWVHDQLFDSPFGQTAFGLTPAGSILSGSHTDHNISPSVTVSWRPSDELTAYASYKTGFLGGGFSTTGDVSAGQGISQFSFGPEKVSGVEGGVKFFLDDRKVQINIDAYDYRYVDLQLNTFNPTTISFYVQNAGKVFDRGVEINGRWKVGDGVTLFGNFTYNDAYYAQFVGACLATVPAYNPNGPANQVCGPQGQNFAGTETDNAPKWVGRVAAQYTHEFPEDFVLHSSAGLDFTDKYLVAQFPIQPGYVKVDAQISVDHGPWTASVIGLNLNNVEVCTEAAGRPLAADISELQCVIDRGRQIKLEATYHF
jgi:outer membrane receptor protein involved in Fe transport